MDIAELGAATTKSDGSPCLRGISRESVKLWSRLDDSVASSVMSLAGLHRPGGLVERRMLESVHAVVMAAQPSIDAYRHDVLFENPSFGSAAWFADVGSTEFSAANGINLGAMKSADMANTMKSLIGSSSAMHAALPSQILGPAVNDALGGRLPFDLFPRDTVRHANQLKSIVAPFERFGASVFAYLDQELRTTPFPGGYRAFDPGIRSDALRIKPRRPAERKRAEAPFPDEMRLFVEMLLKELIAARAEARTDARAVQSVQVEVAEMRAELRKALVERDTARADIKVLQAALTKMESKLTRKIQVTGQQGASQARRYLIISLVVSTLGLDPQMMSDKMDEWIHGAPSVPALPGQPPVVAIPRDLVLRPAGRRGDTPPE